MKKSLLLAVAVTALMGMAARAEMKCPMKEGDCEAKKAEMVDHRVKELTKELNLTEEQQAKVKASLEKGMTEKCALNEETQKKMDGIMESTQGEVRAALTPEQQAQLDSMKEKGKCCAMGGKKGHKCPTKKEKACCPMSGGKSKK